MRHDGSDSRCRTELSEWGQRVFLTAHFQITRVISLAPAGNAADSHEYAIYLVGGSYDEAPILMRARQKICVRRSIDHVACRDRRYCVIPAPSDCQSNCQSTRC
jgi:hypothetical protein